MSFLIKIFLFLLVLNYPLTESSEFNPPDDTSNLEPNLLLTVPEHPVEAASVDRPDPQTIPEFKFDAISLGHCGLLITWKPNITTYSKEPFDFFTFEKYVIEEKNDGNTESDDGQSHEVAINNITYYNGTHDLQCRSDAGQYKINFLNENTLYEVIVNHYRTSYDIQKYGPDEPGDPILKKYSLKKRTNFKSKNAPAKPYFEYIWIYNLESFPGLIRWYPCGKERICHNQESGTHFGIKIKAPYSTKRVNERKIEEFQNDYKTIILWPGVVYEVVVYSVNGEFETDSDSEEIFYSPRYSQVQYVNAISLPDLSILFSWKPPKQCLEKLQEYCIGCINYSEPNIDMPELGFLFEEDVSAYYKNQTKDITRILPSLLEQGRVFGLVPDVVYTCLIFSVGYDRMIQGLPYKMQYKLELYNDDLPIAKPDFSYKKITTENSTSCDVRFQWLPCGISFECKNTIPGSNYSFQIKPEFEKRNVYKYNNTRIEENGFIACRFNKTNVYSVSVISSTGNKTSKSETKTFKDCEEIRENIKSEL